mmetsp:Transcript_30463/g.34634  ORF Transcript_30463/g.34634 Transcript_30463/m.34634 type:complete len:573 (+) Transcript_30463:66-1784(+)
MDLSLLPGVQAVNIICADESHEETVDPFATPGSQFTYAVFQGKHDSQAEEVLENFRSLKASDYCQFSSLLMAVNAHAQLQKRFPAMCGESGPIRVRVFSDQEDQLIQMLQSKWGFDPQSNNFEFFDIEEYEEVVEQKIEEEKSSGAPSSKMWDRAIDGAWREVKLDGCTDNPTKIIEAVKASKYAKAKLKLPSGDPCPDVAFAIFLKFLELRKLVCESLRSLLVEKKIPQDTNQLQQLLSLTKGSISPIESLEMSTLTSSAQGEKMFFSDVYGVDSSRVIERKEPEKSFEGVWQSASGNISSGLLTEGRPVGSASGRIMPRSKFETRNVSMFSNRLDMSGEHREKAKELDRTTLKDPTLDLVISKTFREFVEYMQELIKQTDHGDATKLPAKARKLQNMVMQFATKNISAKKPVDPMVVCRSCMKQFQKEDLIIDHMEAIVYKVNNILVYKFDDEPTATKSGLNEDPTFIYLRSLVFSDIFNEIKTNPTQIPRRPDRLANWIKSISKKELSEHFGGRDETSILKYQNLLEPELARALVDLDLVAIRSNRVVLNPEVLETLSCDDALSRAGFT